MSENWIVFPCYNLLPLTKRAVATAHAQDIPVNIWVVNNASTDNTASWLAGQDDLTRTHHYPALPSLASLWNTCLRKIFEEWHGEYALVANNDIELRPDAYRLLLEDGGGFVTCVGVDELKYKETQNARPALTRSPHPDFSCFLIRKWVWEKVGPFDEGYLVAYYEDNDYHVRMHRAGIKSYALDIPFWHHAAATIKTLPPDERRALELQAGANKQRFYAQYGCYPGTPQYNELFKGEQL